MNTTMTITDAWEDLTSAGRELAQASDRNRWALGDLASRVEKRYGDDVFGKFAAEINMRQKTLRDYERVYTFYGEKPAYADNLSWSHCREAARLKEISAALWALGKAADRDWTIEKMGRILSRYLGTARKPRKLLDATAPARVGDGLLTLVLTPEQAAQVDGYAHLRIVVYEPEAA